MGLVLAEFEDSPKIDVKYMKKVSLEDYKYIHTNDFVDLVPLFVEDHQDIFDSADKILIERQPPGGFTNIEILLNYMFKDKVILISPVSMHMHFGMRHLNYEERKERTVSIADKYIEMLKIDTPSPDQPIKNLSEGNQQKVIVARELSRPLRLSIAAQPTRGVWSPTFWAQRLRRGRPCRAVGGGRWRSRRRS